MKESQFQESIDTFKVRFEGGNSIDAELFTKIINNTVELVKASSRAIDPNAFLRLEIKATKEGSFETTIDAVARYIPDLINKDNIRLAVEIVAGFLSFLQLKSHLKGRKPKAIEKSSKSSIVINQDGEALTATTNIVNCYFNDHRIDNSIVQIFNDLSTSPRDGMVVEHGNQHESFQRMDYKKMSSIIIEQDQPVNSKQTSEIIKSCALIIKKPDLIGRSRWEMIFAGQAINIKIEDEDFLAQIKDGTIKLSGGCKLICDLTVKAEIDDEYNVMKLEHIVLKVHGIENKEEQLNLFSLRS